MKSELIDLAADLGEAVLDTQLAEGILQEIPIFGSFIRMAKAAASVPDKIFARKIARFLTAFESCSEQQVRGFREKLEGNPDESQKAGEATLHALDAADDGEKAKIIGMLFRHYLGQALTLDELRRMLSAINRSFVEDLRALVGSMGGWIQWQYFDNAVLLGTPLVVIEYPRHITMPPAVSRQNEFTVRHAAPMREPDPKVVITALGVKFANLLAEWVIPTKAGGA